MCVTVRDLRCDASWMFMHNSSDWERIDEMGAMYILEDCAVMKRGKGSGL